MATKKSPLARQKDEHESKEKLVDRVVALLASIKKSDDDKDALKARLLAASNKKLLRLADVAGEIKSKWGSVDKLAAAIGEALGRQKDAPYVQKLAAISPARLFDLWKTAEKRGKKKAA
jgi:hypothetical protein